ncbi:cuticle protein 19-like [Schistocerca piceifrons]|uniref:cuticle protein 19-like n=1 Tax=Schistocerca piceifrons TaxID=274613 RepID=UPI001F5EBE7F|nr:cuticle protein 19-like [Schistocerca piceifrons]
MVCKALVVAAAVALLATAASGYPGYAEGGYGHNVQLDYHAPAKYDFEYAVHDPHTGDVKQQSESRHGDVVQGHYSLVEPGGALRTVHYSADPHSGFRAVVSRPGPHGHPEVTYHGHGHH